MSLPLRTRALALSTAGAVSLLAAGCSSTPPAHTGTLALEEIRAGVAKGYLSADQLPDSADLLPPPPVPGSPAQALDEHLSQVRSLRGTPRWEQAIVDSNVQFPSAASIFSCAIGIDINEHNAPRLYALLRRSRTDAAAVSDAAKDLHQRPRPFMANGEATCTPEKEAGLAGNGSYPSGHTSIGAAWALILAELAPDRATQILDRGRHFGHSRMVCNVHWHSDVAAGRDMGAAVVARLHAEPAFRADMEVARAEMAALLASGAHPPRRDCAAEAAALAIAPPVPLL